MVMVMVMIMIIILYSEYGVQILKTTFVKEGLGVIPIERPPMASLTSKDNLPPPVELYYLATYRGE